MAKKPRGNGKATPKVRTLTSARYGEQEVQTGSGGEVHQTADAGIAILTTQQGIPVADDQNSLRLGVKRRKVLSLALAREPQQKGNG